MTEIALVDDDRAVRECLATLFAQRGYRVREYERVSDAREGISENRPDLCVVDGSLPDGSGLDLLRSLRVRFDERELPVVIVSAQGEEEDLLAAFEAGANDYLTKPVSTSELLAKTALLLARKPGAAKTRKVPCGSDLPGGADAAFGRYRVEGKLGEGGSSTVYDAVDTRSGVRVALKVLTPLAITSEGARERFLRETYALSAIEHPLVVRVLDFGAKEGRPYYSMERVSGPTLAARVADDGVLREAEAVSLLCGLATAVDALEEAGLVHRDIKPENVVLEHGDVARPVLIDFGLAKHPHDRTLTLPGTFVGTPSYAAPEAVLGWAVDARSDLFSIGLVTRFALTGREAFPNRSRREVLRALASQPVPIPRRLSEPFRSILRKLTRIQPDERFSSARAVLEALEPLRGAPSPAAA